MPATTTSKPRSGERVELRRYRIPDGERGGLLGDKLAEALG